MGFPDKKEIARVLKRLEKVPGTLGLREKPSALQKLRWDICQQFLIYKRVKACSQKEMAKLAEVDEAKMSKILHHRIDEFSTDRLISIFEKLNPHAVFKVG